MQQRQWKHKLNIGDIFHNDDLDIVEKSTEISKRIANKFPKLIDDSLAIYDEELFDVCWRLGNLVEVAGDDDLTETFDNIWDEFYDWADANRVWVTTRGEL